MKKSLSMVVAAMMATMNVSAQDEWKNEISIAYGGGANTDIVTASVEAYIDCINKFKN